MFFSDGDHQKNSKIFMSIFVNVSVFKLGPSSGHAQQSAGSGWVGETTILWKSAAVLCSCVKSSIKRKVQWSYNRAVSTQLHSCSTPLRKHKALLVLISSRIHQLNCILGWWKATNQEGKDGKEKLHTCLANPKSASLTSPLGPTSMFPPFISLPRKVQVWSDYCILN